MCKESSAWLLEVVATEKNCVMVVWDVSLTEVGSVTAICFTCFLIRAVVAAWAAFNDTANVDSLYHPILNLFYYVIVEIIPAALVLFILRKLPPKRVTGHYHAIR
ncbi:hypothetical protein L7F22_056477 [Adiantum nelumboides]|nr:hypothetical protein [Adiantum nelumboides]